MDSDGVRRIVGAPPARWTLTLAGGRELSGVTLGELRAVVAALQDPQPALVQNLDGSLSLAGVPVKLVTP